MTQKESFNTFKVYTASAGSGKTFRLTLEYLKIALSQPEDKFKKILAITFTVKATNEMKERIIEACQRFARANQTPLDGRNLALFESLIEETGWTEEEIIDKANTLYKKILHNYGDFSISTIDSFSQRLIRAFAFELRIPLQFEVIIDPSATIDYLLSEVLAQVGQNPPFTQLLTHFFLNKLNQDDSIHIESDIEKAIHVLFDEDNTAALENLSSVKTNDFYEEGKKLFAKTLELSRDIKKIAGLAITVVDEAGYQLQNLKFKGSGGFGDFIKVYNDVNEDLGARFIKAMNGENNWLNEGEEDDYIESTLTFYAKELYEKSNQFKIYNILRKSYPQIALLATISQIYNQYKKEEEFLLISEFNNTINKEVSGQPAPFIYEKVGEYYDHILLDEFQDTSVIQWQNLVPLVAEILSQEGQPESMVVGDSKQAIYRFRGGETKQLTQLPKLIGADQDPILKEQEEILGQYIQKENLKYNFRSREEIINFNNNLYGYIANHPDLSDYKDIYSNFYQKVSKKDSGGHVSINFIEKEEDEDKEDLLEKRLNLVTEQIISLKNRGFAYHEMAILCRVKKEVRQVAESLQQAGIPIISQESLSLEKQSYISTFPALVQWFTQPDNQVLQTKIVNGFHEVGLLNVSKHQINKDIGLLKMTSVQEFSDYIAKLNKSIQLKNLGYTELLGLFETYCSWLPEHIQQSAFVSFFRDEIWKLIQKEGNHLEAFIDWWRENRAKLFVKSSTQSEGVNLMTIHKSKGLEFEAVLLPFADWKFSSGFHLEYRWLPTDKLGEHIHQAYIPMVKALEGTEYDADLQLSKSDNLLDHINLLYVATTRAVSELHIVTQLTTSKTKNLKKFTNMSILWDSYLSNGQAIEHTFGKPVIKTAVKEIKEEKPEFELGRLKKQFGKASVAVKNKSAVIWNKTTREKIDFGELVHGLLERINTKNDIENVIYQAIAEGLLKQEDSDTIKILINEVVNHPELSDFFNNTKNVLAEQSIISPDGKELIPDRIAMVGKNEIKILDFKTGEIQSKHKKQIENYASVLSQMGFAVVSKQLVYVQPFKIVSL